MALSTFSVEFAHLEEISTAIQQYFICEAAGSEVECDRSSFEDLSFHRLVLVGYFLFGLLPVVNLAFVINWKSAKASYKHFWTKYYQKVISKHTSPTVSSNNGEANNTHESAV